MYYFLLYGVLSDIFRHEGFYVSLSLSMRVAQRPSTRPVGNLHNLNVFKMGEDPSLAIHRKN